MPPTAQRPRTSLLVDTTSSSSARLSSQAALRRRPPETHYLSEPKSPPKPHPQTA
jgi:hypothetical protein